MAQVDTGLGWLVESEWLLRPGGTIYANIVRDTGFRLPVFATTPSSAEMANCPIEWQRISVGDGAKMASGTEGVYAFLAVYSGIANAVAVSRTANATIYSSTFNSGGTYSPSSRTLRDDVYNRPGWYYTTSPAAIGYSSDIYSDMPVIEGTSLSNAIQTYVDSIVTETIPIYKLNPGAAAAGVAEFYTMEGNVLIAPVLISTVPEYAVISTDGQTPAENATVFDFLYDGARFYMALYGGNSDPVTTISPYADLKQFAAAAPSKVFTLLASDSFANITVTVSPDPYGEEGGGSGEEGGDGDSDPENDPVEEETLPIPAVSGLGFSTIYVPTAYDLSQLASYLWGGNLDLDNFLRLFANPMDSILGLSAVPLSLSGTYEPIYLGGQILQGVTMPRYTGRTAVKVDMGSVSISERWGSYLDYDPYTEFAVYLPFIGIKNIKADDIMGKTVSLMYNIDILSGACVAYLRTTGGSVLYEWAGQCAMQIPITGSNWDNIFSTAISTAVTLGGAMVAPASAPMLAGSVASAAVQAVAAKPRVERSGAVTGVTGFLGQLRPYIIRTIPEAYIPNDQNKFIGYPSYISASLGSLTGYNEVASIHLENIPATGDELSELESILKGGVIF